jgi:hypothetical protein
VSGKIVNYIFLLEYKNKIRLATFFPRGKVIYMTAVMMNNFFFKYFSLPKWLMIYRPFPAVLPPHRSSSSKRRKKPFLLLTRKPCWAVVGATHKSISKEEEEEEEEEEEKFFPWYRSVE